MPTAIVKPTHDCNMACRYCYVEEEAERGTMNDETLQNTIEKFTRYYGKDSKIHFIWHGGEPLLMGLDFFKKIVDIEKNLRERGYKIKNGVQTNGTLLTEEFIDFVEEQDDFHLGMSLDGPEDIHNYTRPYKNGSDTFEDIMKAISMIKKRGNSKISGGVISILNKRSIGKIEDIYRFFKENEINIKVNPLIKSGRARTNYDELAITPREYGETLIKLFEMWYYDGTKIDIDPLSDIMGNLMTSVPCGCDYEGDCQKSFISVGPTGAVYPCGRFDGLGEFYMGNINEDEMEKIDHSPLREKLKSRGVEKIRVCEPCDYNIICNGGCMHNAYMITGDPMKRDHYCTGNKMIFRHIEKTLHTELKRAEV